MTPQQLKNSILQRAIEGRLVEQRLEEGTARELIKEIQAEMTRLVKEGKIKKDTPPTSCRATPHCRQAGRAVVLLRPAEK